MLASGQEKVDGRAVTAASFGQRVAKCLAIISAFWMSLQLQPFDDFVCAHDCFKMV
jgi:hypothetical protein